MSEVEWRFCGQFNPQRQRASSLPGDWWIDEAEARTRLDDSSKRLTVVAPVDAATGVAPWHIVVTTGEYPSFTVVYVQPPGVPSAKAWWKGLDDGRLFADRVEWWEYPADGTAPAPRTNRDAVRHLVLLNNEDGKGRLMAYEKGNPKMTTGDRRFDPAPLYAPVPDWGHWEQLASITGVLPDPFPGS